MFVDKVAVMQVLGGLLKDPSLLSETEKYQLDNQDFTERFHIIIFAAINNLYNSGNIRHIDEIEVDGFLREYPVQYEIFNQNDGVEYLQNIQELHKEGNFDYYYERVKKFTLLREMHGLGFDVSEVYDETIMNPREQERLLEKFDEMSIADILRVYEAKMNLIQDMFESSSEARGIHAGEGIDELLDRLEQSPDIGLPLNSELLTSASRGCRRQKFYLRSSYSGGGKTRSMIGDALRLSAKGWYDSEKGEWIANEFNVKSVVISTEMTFEELQTPALAYIADIDEDKIQLNTMTNSERERLRDAANILKQSNVYLEHLPNFDVKDIERTIVKNIINHDVEYVFFDYLHSNVTLLGDFARASGINLREDQILLFMADSLKAIANKHDVFLMSATQLNDSWKEASKNGEDIDFAVVRGSKAIVDKADFFCVMLPISQREKKETEDIAKSLNSFPHIKPNTVTHISKNRGNRHTNLKIFSHMDMGTVKVRDLYVTDFDNKPVVLDKITVKQIEYSNQDTRVEE